MLNSLIVGGGVTCSSADATAFANAAQGVLGIQVWGGALANCANSIGINGPTKSLGTQTAGWS